VARAVPFVRTDLRRLSGVASGCLARFDRAGKPIDASWAASARPPCGFVDNAPRCSHPHGRIINSSGQLRCYEKKGHFHALPTHAHAASRGFSKLAPHSVLNVDKECHHVPHSYCRQWRYDDL
jgi:hypothetical protein